MRPEKLSEAFKEPQNRVTEFLRVDQAGLELTENQPPVSWFFLYIRNPASWASWALTIDNKPLFCKNPQTAG